LLLCPWDVWDELGASNVWHGWYVTLLGCSLTSSSSRSSTLASSPASSCCSATSSKLRHVLQTVVGCCCTLVDIGVVLRAGISVWGVVRRFVALDLPTYRCSWSTVPFDSSWLVAVDVVASCSRRAAGEMHSSALHAR